MKTLNKIAGFIIVAFPVGVAVVALSDFTISPLVRAYLKFLFATSNGRILVGVCAFFALVCGALTTILLKLLNTSDE